MALVLAAVTGVENAELELKTCQLCNVAKPMEDMVDNCRCKACNPLRCKIIRLKKEDERFKEAFANFPNSKCIGKSHTQK